MPLRPRTATKLQFLYWHKSGLATKRSWLAALPGKTLPTIAAWAKRHNRHDLSGLLEMDY